MADTSWEHAAEARAALNAIVTDPEHGVGALSSPRTMSNLLKDLLPDAPREKNLLVAAAEAGLADTLRDHVDQGMDAGTAIRLTASSFSERSPLSHDACTWVTNEVAKAMGIGGGSAAGGAAWGNPAGGGAEAWAGNPTFSPGSQDNPSAHWAPAGASSPGASSPGAGANGWGASNVANSNPSDSNRGGPGKPGDLGYAQAPSNGHPGLAGYEPADRQAFAPMSGPAYSAYPAGGAYGPAPVPGYQPGPTRSRSSNTLAVVAFVLGLVQFIGWIVFLLPGLLAAILAIVLGFVSLRQVKRSGEGGRGLAIIGVILGFTGIAIVAILAVIGVAALNHNS